MKVCSPQLWNLRGLQQIEAWRSMQLMCPCVTVLARAPGVALLRALSRLPPADGAAGFRSRQRVDALLMVFAGDTDL